MQPACKTALCCFWTFDCQVWLHAAVFLCFIYIAGRAAKPCFIVFITMTIKMIRLFLLFATVCGFGYTLCVFDYFIRKKRLWIFLFYFMRPLSFYRMKYFFIPFISCHDLAHYWPNQEHISISERSFKLFKTEWRAGRCWGSGDRCPNE